MKHEPFALSLSKGIDKLNPTGHLNFIRQDEWSPKRVSITVWVV